MVIPYVPLADGAPVITPVAALIVSAAGRLGELKLSGSLFGSLKA
jgi:hypothetical protein